MMAETLNRLQSVKGRFFKQILRKFQMVIGKNKEIEVLRKIADALEGTFTENIKEHIFEIIHKNKYRKYIEFLLCI